ncbi:MAG: polysaccharide pyruvyl transferase family protein [Planctomycetota bacterium]|nr:MAG: polysaccharide pyruvyl transferase family protein [Planctomycetota bacterium]
MRGLHLDLNWTSAIDDAYKLDADQLMKATGGNFGNLVFRHALKSILSKLDSFLPVTWPEARQFSSSEKVECVLVSCANWLGTSEEDERRNLGRAQIIESFDCPVVPFGLGVQAPSGAESVELGPNTRRLAEALSLKCNLMSLRDSLTARTLEGLGISNAIVTGCPSNFINPDPWLGKSIVERANGVAARVSSWGQVRTLISEVGTSNLRSRKSGLKSIEFLHRYPSFYVLQSPNMMEFMVGVERDIPAGYNLTEAGITEAELRAILLSKAIYFTSVDAWLDFSRTCSFCFGNRVHGTMVALQAGVPSILIGHDARTEGLAKEMALPMVAEESFSADFWRSPREAMSLVINLMEEYDDRRSVLGSRFKLFVNENDLEPSSVLSGFPDGSSRFFVS